MNTGKKDDKGNYSQNCWLRFERVILILTFFCTLAGTMYAVLTSNKALKISSNELRPWISIEKIDSYFHKDSIENKFVIRNIGKVPAFLNIEVQTEVDGKKMHKEDIPEGPIVLMPGQILRKPGFAMSGDKYRKMLEGGYSPETYQNIVVYYSESKKDIKKYSVYYRVKFHTEKIPRPLLNGTYHGAGFWTFEESDFR